MDDPLDILGIVADREFQHAVLFGETDAIGAMVNISTHSEMRRQPTAQLRLDPTLLPADPIDYLAPLAIVAKHETFNRPLFVGAAIEALPTADEITIEALSAVALGESGTPGFEAYQMPRTEIIHYLARTAGMRDEQLRIDGLDALPMELFEVVVPIDGLAVEARVKIGNVSILPRETVARRLKGLGDQALESFDGRCCAVAIVRRRRTIDAEEEGLADIDRALSWLIVRSRYGTALLPDGTPQKFRRREARSAPRRGESVFVRGIASNRRWAHGADPGYVAPELQLSEDHRFLDHQDAVNVLNEQTREAILALARSTRESGRIAQVGALWDAIEFFVGQHKPRELFSKAERRKLKRLLPGDLSEQQLGRARNLIDEQLNNAPLRRRLEEVLDNESIPYTDAEVHTLFALRKVRNDAVHGRVRVEPTDEQIEQATAFISRMIVHRVWRERAV